MVSKNAPVRAESGGTHISRRTVARGAAWSVPVAAVAFAAPAFAASCDPVISFSPDSCKCPGQSTNTEEFVYYLKFCVADACTLNPGETFVVTDVQKSNGTQLDQAPNSCFPATLPSSPQTVGAPGTPNCTTDIFRFVGVNSGNFLIVNFDTILNGVTTHHTAKVASPPKCADINQSQRCQPCT